jgi:hypothetical protein
MPRVLHFQADRIEHVQQRMTLLPLMRCSL